jgi:hypothetical protein
LQEGDRVEPMAVGIDGVIGAADHPLFAVSSTI